MKTTHYRNKINPNEQHYNGLGMSPRPTDKHQEMIGLFFDNFGYYLLKQDKLKTYKILTESELGTPNSVAPDIVIKTKTKKQPVFIIEIETTKHIKKTIEKTIIAIKQYPTIKEALLFDYNNKIFYRIYKNGNYKIAKRSSFFKINLLDIHKFNLKDKEILRLKKLLKTKK